MLAIDKSGTLIGLTLSAIVNWLQFNAINSWTDLLLAATDVCLGLCCLQVANFTSADPDYGGRIAKLLAEYKAVSGWACTVGVYSS